MPAYSLPRTVGVALYARLARRTFFAGPNQRAPMTPARLMRMLRFVPVFFLTQMWNRVCLRLDDLLFPGYRAVEVREPVFVCGMPRCGTTLLHRVLGQDSATTSFTLWELILAPSILQRRFYRAIGHVDRALGGHAKRGVQALFLKAASDMRRYHPIDLWEAEEDELVLMPYFASSFLVFPFPYYDLLHHLTRFDDVMEPQGRADIMARYRELVQRHLYVHGPEKRFLSKNPLMSAKIASIGKTFPDARVLCNVRTPFEAIPSMLSLFRYLEGFFKTETNRPDFTAHYLEVADYFYGHPLDLLPDWAANRHAFVRYPELVGDLAGTVERLYARLELTMDEAFRARLHQMDQETRQYKSAHAYSLEDYGLSAGELAHRFAAVFAAFDFPAVQDASGRPGSAS